MFNRLKRLYEKGVLTKAMLRTAVTPRKWITKKQYKEITGEQF